MQGEHNPFEKMTEWRQNLCKDSNLFELFNEVGANLTLQNIVEKIAKQFAVIVEALERDILCNVVSVVRHCCYNVAMNVEERERVVAGGRREKVAW